MNDLINEFLFDSSKVYIIGGGSGDKKHLTVEAHSILSQADIVLHDMYMDNLKVSYPKIEWIHSGKQSGFHSKKQSEINEMIIDYFKKGKKTVRLKAGDINFYARTSEEINFLKSNGIDFHLIPGISSPQLLGIALKESLTHREKSRSLSYWSGYWDKEIDSNEIPSTGGHIIFMGHSKIHEWVQKLLNKGKDPNTVLIAASHLGREKQKILKTTLAKANEELAIANLENPVLIAIGLNHI
jgi:siroheme synthase